LQRLSFDFTAKRNMSDINSLVMNNNNNNNNKLYFKRVTQLVFINLT
jgi:hypothetical protein